MKFTNPLTGSNRSNGLKNFEKKSNSSNKIVKKCKLDKELRNLRNLLPRFDKCMDEVSSRL